MCIESLEIIPISEKFCLIYSKYCRNIALLVEYQRSIHIYDLCFKHQILNNCFVKNFKFCNKFIINFLFKIFNILFLQKFVFLISANFQWFFKMLLKIFTELFYLFQIYHKFYYTCICSQIFISLRFWEQYDFIHRQSWGFGRLKHSRVLKKFVNK